MIRLDTLKRELHQLVGWSQDPYSSHRIWDRLQQSDSGLYFQAAHPLLTVENIASILPERNYQQWDNQKTYITDEIVQYEGKLYQAKKLNEGIAPDTSDYNQDYNEDFGSAYWKRYDPICRYLDSQVDNGIAAMVNTFLADKTIAGKSKQILEHKCFYDNVGRASNRINPVGKLVGFEIEPQKAVGITVQLHRLGLQMVGGSGVVTMYLFHSSRPEPIKTFNVRVYTQGGCQWFNLDNVFMPYMSEYTNTTGVWYLCYNQPDLPYGMEAVNINRDWAKDPCHQCSRVDMAVWKTMTRYIRISPFEASVGRGFADNPRLDPSTVMYTPTMCYGINAEISIGCDLTDFILSQRHIFANVLQKQVCADTLRAIAFNPHVNTSRYNLNVLRNDIIASLDGSTTTRSGGLVHELAKAYKALDLDTTGLETACLSCKHNGIRLGGI